MNYLNVGVIGAGSMAGSIIPQVDSDKMNLKFRIFTPSYTSAESLAIKCGGVAVRNISDLAGCDVFFLACKPQQISQVAKEIRLMTKEKLVISILAGTKLDSLGDMLLTSQVAKVMPNTPSQLGKGFSLISYSKELKAEFKELVVSLMSYCGEVHECVNEKELDDLTAFSGSGPAYLFRFTLAYANKLIEMGYSNEFAHKIMNHTFLGSAELMSQEALNYKELISKVASKGGVTQEALNCLEENNLDIIISDSIDRAHKKTFELENLSR